MFTPKLNLKLFIMTFLCLSSLATALPVTTSQGTDAKTDDTCGFFNVIEIPDPEGDATQGAPSYVDILGLTIRQLGELVQFEWKADGNPVNNDDSWYLLALDTDRNPDTGQNWAGSGAELKISIQTFPEGPSVEVVMAYIAADGNTVLNIERTSQIVLTDTGFILNIEKSRIPADQFNLNFATVGNWWDEGTLTEIHLQPARDPVQVKITSSNLVQESKPTLINIPQKTTGVQLSASLVRNVSSTPLDSSQVSYTVSHPRDDYISNPESIISIDVDDIAHYNSEGYVTAWATLDACQIGSEKIILATGDVYGDPITQKVLAVFPTDYVPDGSNYSFGDMMSGYPDMMRYVDIGYGITSYLYAGFRPFAGEKQILAPLVADELCGGPGNPLATSPCCYMNCGDASPQYSVIIHEMGHNFADSKGMRQLLYSDQGEKIDAAGFGECVASLPVIYFEEEIRLNGEAYDILPGSYEYKFSKENREYFCSTSQAGLNEFERFIDQGLIDGVFDNDGLFDGVQVLCSFFEAFSCGYIDGENLHKHHMIRRFLHIFGDSELPEFIPEKVETYFAAAYSVAAGRDMRTKLAYWGFTIDAEYYAQIKPLISARLRAVPDPNDDMIFKDGFEND